MNYFGLICSVLALVNNVKLNPVVNVPASSVLQDSNFEPVVRINRPIELKPQSWDSFTPEVTQVDTRFRSAVPSLRTPFRDSNPPVATTVSIGLGTEVPSMKIYSPVEVPPSSLDLGVEPTTPVPTPKPTQPPSPVPAPFTKAPEIDSMPFSIRLRPRSDHQIGPPNSTVFVFGDGFMKPIDQREFTIPRFNPLFFLRSALRESPQPIKMKVVRELPYFRFFAPGMERLLAQMKAEHRRVRRSPLHRVKRHHTAVLQNVLGQLQNFALVPIRSTTGRTNYILLRNPKFVIGGNVVSPTPPAAPVPTVIQIGQPTVRPVQNVVFQPSVVLPSRQSAPSHVGRNSRPQSVQLAQPVAQVASVDYHLQGHDHAHHVPIHANTRQQPVALLGGRDTSDFNDRPRVSAARNIQSSVAPEIAIGINNVNPIAHRPSLGGSRGGGYRGASSRRGGMMGGSRLGSTGGIGHTGTGGDVGGVQQTEVVETVVETQQHQQAAATGSQAASTVTGGVSSVVAGGAKGSGSGGVLTDTVQTAQTASAGSASAVKQGKKVVTKKTTTTKLKGDGAGGAVKEVSQVVEQSVHKDQAVATSDTAATSVGVASGSSVVASDGNAGGVSNDGAASASGAASAVASSASSAAASNTSVKSVKTIKKTTVTKTKLAKPGGGINLPKTVPSAMSIIDTTGVNKQASLPKAKTAILSDNNDRRAINKQPALIATQAPRKAARVVKQRRRRPKKATTKTPPTTAEIEMEGEEFSTTEAYGALGHTATPLPLQYGFTQRYQPTNAPSGVAGWAGTTIEPALGPNDRINTTDVPEEIEPFPDKTPAEKRRELRKLARERARKAGLPPPKFVPAPRAPTQRQQNRGYNANHGHSRPTTLSSLHQVGPTAMPSSGVIKNGVATNAPPTGVAGWAGTTIEPALGPNDRINTTDVPEEIEPFPDKTPAEKRRELRKLARERARKAGLPPPKFVSAPPKPAPAPAPKLQNNGHYGHNTNHGHHQQTTISSLNQAGPTATPSYGMGQTRAPANAQPAGVAGWAGTTIEPALGPNDRINTTDVPEEIEPFPDKTPAEKRRELRQMARERAAAAAKAKKQPASNPAPRKSPNPRPKPQPKPRPQPRPQPTQQQYQQPRYRRPVPRYQTKLSNNRVWRNVITRDRNPKFAIPRSRSRPYIPPQDRLAGPTTYPPPVGGEGGPQRQSPPRGRQGRNRGRNSNRNRGRWGSNNRRRPNRRSREREERPPFRDPFARWLYNNIDTEMVEKILPLWFLG